VCFRAKAVAQPRRLRKASRRILACTAILFATAASLAHAELTQRGDLFVSFSGGIAPTALPRHSRAPISVRVSGVVRTLSGERPPALRQIKIAINRDGHLDTRGLPVCRMRQIEASSNEQALLTCGSALVGGGSYLAKTAFPEQLAFPSDGRILAFNSVVGGRQAILAHIYGTDPVPIVRIIVFYIQHVHGAYGTLLTGALPETINHYGYVKRLSLNLHRDYAYRGQRHSYISAACAAPPGFPRAIFPFAHASMSFADGRTLASTLTRSCKVKG
jgi:hypothetical protein